MFEMDIQVMSTYAGARDAAGAGAVSTSASKRRGRARTFTRSGSSERQTQLALEGALIRLCVHDSEGTSRERRLACTRSDAVIESRERVVQNVIGIEAELHALRFADPETLAGAHIETPVSESFEVPE